MAVVQPLTWRQQIFALKTETTTGTAVSLATADTALNASDVSIEGEDGAVERQGPYSADKLIYVPGAGAASVKAKVEIFNDSEASTTPLWFTALGYCGFTISGGVATLAIGAATLNNATAGHWIDGWKYFAAGCMFAPELMFEAGQIPYMQLDGKGIWQTPIAEALPSFTSPVSTPTVATATTFTLGGTSYVSPRASIKPQCKVELRQNMDSAGGYVAAFIGDANPIWDVDVEMQALATKDWFSVYQAKTTFAGSLAYGAGTNGIVTVASPALQLYKRPEKFNGPAGQAMLKLALGAVRNSANGGDSLTVTLS